MIEPGGTRLGSDTGRAGLLGVDRALNAPEHTRQGPGVL